MWHLTHLSFENYRTFERPESIELRPLTVLIGRNSSGKSAIARLPLLLQRGFTTTDGPPLALEFDGHDFGSSFADLVTNGITTRAITLGAIASDGDESVELRAAIGYWKEFNLQAIHEYVVKVDGEDELVARWDGRGDPRAPGLAYAGYEAGELFFRGLQPFQNFGLSGIEGLEDAGISHEPQRHMTGLMSSLAGLRYLGPFRDAPQRDARIPEAEIKELGPRGGHAGDILANDWLRNGGGILRRVSDWYKETLGGWQLDLERQGNRFSVVMRSPTDPNVAVNLRDAGVGLSQVLPVVLQHELNQMQGSVGELHVVEQPELHLHPGAHGAIADLYIDAAKQGTSRFIVETHSENLILRIRRRIAERTLSPEDVALYWVNEDVTATPRIQRINIDEMGGIDFWPTDVFSEDLKEVQAIRLAQKRGAP